MSLCPFDEATPGERELAAMAAACGLVAPHERLPEALLAYGLAVVHACALIGDGYWHDDASAGQHIRAAYYP